VLLGAVDAWRWVPHPEVWFLVGAIVALGGYAVRVIGPKVVPAGEAVVTRKQVTAFVVALVLLWVASDWPMHDIAEQHLYFLHMIQHVLITLVVPPLFLLATPEWLARLVVLDDGRASRILRTMSRPVAAGLLYSALAALTHWTAVVNASVDNGALHYGLHLALFASALLMWTPVVGPLPELRLTRPAAMLYLFLMSIIPTVPAGWLTFAEGPVYSAYDLPERLWNISVIDDQQLAGLIMKIVAGFYLWGIIFVMFLRWARTQDRANQRPPVTINRDLTFDDVQRAFDDAGPAAAEPADRAR
jgi:putative membrane protein